MNKRCRCDFIGRAARTLLLTGAVLLPPDTVTFGCSVSLLARFATPQTTWICQIPPTNPCRCQAQCGHLFNASVDPTGLPASSQPLQQASPMQDYRYAPLTRRKKVAFACLNVLSVQINRRSSYTTSYQLLFFWRLSRYAMEYSFVLLLPTEYDYVTLLHIPRKGKVGF